MVKDKPKLLFVTRGLGLGGAQKVLVFVANLCAEVGYNVTLISLTHTKTTLKINENVNIKYVIYDTNKVNQSNFITKTFLQLSFLMRLRKTINNIEPELIIVFLSDVVRMVALSLTGRNIPIIGSERGNPLGYSKRMYKKYSRAYRKCNTVVFQTKKAASAYEGDIQKKSFVISNPCIPRLESIKPYQGIRKKVIATAGRLDDQKRFDILIFAFNKVVKEHPEYKLYIYGDGERRDYLQNLIGKLNLNNKVILKGKEKDVFSKIYNCSAFVLSSDFEGIPNVLIEAMSIGIPCISTDCDPGGPKQLLDNGRRGLLVPVGDINGMAKAINLYIENPEQANNYGKLGMEIKEELSPEKIGKRWLDIIEYTLG